MARLTKLRERLFSTIFFRSILTLLGNRNPYSARIAEFVPYFQFKVGPYHNDYYLYFRKPPFLEVYKNEIFNKMYEYSGYDIARYLEFHYEAYADKGEFERFLQYEISERLKHQVSHTYKLKLQSTLAWLAEKEGTQKTAREEVLKKQIEHDIRPALVVQADAPMDFESVVQTLSDKIASRSDQILSATEEKIGLLTDSFITGNIELNNHNHLEKLIQLYLLIQSIKAPEGSSDDKLFKRNSSTDLASILHLHFKAFKDKKFNTVQVKITECSDRLMINNLKVQKLTKALAEFFF